ncbi:flagellar assembly protein FliW [Oceanobacillus sp. CAU 1775]
MNLETKYLGEVQIDEDKIIRFSKGLPGFPDESSFIILDLPDNNAFQILQSVNTSSLAFVITNPYLFYTDYSLKLDDELLQQLEIEKQEEVAVYTIVTLKQPFSESTINLRAPIVLNTRTLKGKQYILNDNDYSSKASLTTQGTEAK